MVFDTRFKIKSSENKLWYKQSATCFNNALPLGNGRIGAIVFGGVEEEKISINEDTLWSGYPRKNNIEDYPSVYRKAIEMFDMGMKPKEVAAALGFCEINYFYTVFKRETGHTPSEYKKSR